MKGRRAFIASGAAYATLAVAGGSKAADSLSAWRAGVNYRLLDNPQPTTAAAGKVEVTEAFWYGCGHCFALDPVLESWDQGKPSYIEFTRVPVIWGGPHRQHAKLYYTLQALRRPELHAEVFKAIHTKGTVLTDRDEVKARAAALVFFTSFSVTPQQFDDAYDSMTVAMNMQRAENFTRTMRVDNVPLVFVNGKYVTSVSEAGGEPQLVQLINSLAESEKR
jgi:thiol:disulfide interchange protein DsbA